MNPPCSRCNKVVYPTEKVNCLDKFWHKGCFNCEVCHMTLNMKNYKGFDKKPYCNAHYPTTSFTVVADTPENRRLKNNTMIQSQVHYKGEFEKNKGKHTSVSDSPESTHRRTFEHNSNNPTYQPGPVQPVAPVARVAPATGPARTTGVCYRALYDYAAADDDEVSFQEGDLIVNAERIDEGWMYGVVERSGQIGMLPANYVEPV